MTTRILIDKKCPLWSEDHDYVQAVIKSLETHFNELLKARGNVFLNEIYDAFSMPRTQQGCVIGWKRKHPITFKCDWIFIDDEIFDSVIITLNINTNVMQILTEKAEEVKI